MKLLFIKVIRFYQLYISTFLPASCRYYPTCSEYCLLQFKYNTFLKALENSIFRLSKCNAFFDGGLDYPLIERNFFISPIFVNKKMIKSAVWFVPNGKNKYYVVKQFKNKEKM